MRRCRFFNSVPDMQAQVQLHHDPVLSPMLPALLYHHTNSNCTIRTRDSRCIFPPFVALQQGRTLCKWWAARRSEAQVAAMLRALTGHVAALHETGRVHGGLRADLVMQMPDSDEWRLLGLSKCGTAGAAAGRMLAACRTALEHCSCPVLCSAVGAQSIS